MGGESEEQGRTSKDKSFLFLSNLRFVNGLRFQG